eukprot:evm.model.scf_1563.2 EVM.evm.TU.scf_1563.2   scf_1563:10976-23713(+)
MLGAAGLAPRAGYAATAGHQLRPAGLTTSHGESATDAMEWLPRPPTPSGIRKYRQSAVHEPGRVVRHPGVAGDDVPKGPFGVRTVAGEGDSAEALMRCYPESDLGQWLQERKESKYASATREPLGKSFVRGHKLPDGLGEEKPFGILNRVRELEAAGQAGAAICPEDGVIDDDVDPDTHRLYVTSHGSFAPGEQRRRNYCWDSAGINPAVHKFGAVDKDDYREGVRKALNPESDPAILTAPKVVDKKVDEYQRATVDPLGRSKWASWGKGDPREGMTFGCPSVTFHQDGVDKLITGRYTKREQAPDADLGTSLREGWRNTAPEGKVFGIPTVRLDIPAPTTQSVANTQNYGNEPGAHHLIHPTATADRGVNEEHYLKPWGRDQLRSLLDSCGMHMGDGDFEATFRSAGGESQGGTCCIDSFMAERYKRLAQEKQIA